MSSRRPSIRPASHADVERLLLTVPQAAELLGISENHAWHLIGRGELPSVKLGSLRRVSRSALEAWIAEASADSTTGAAEVRTLR